MHEQCIYCNCGSVRPFSFSLTEAILKCDNTECDGFLNFSPIEKVIQKDILSSHSRRSSRSSQALPKGIKNYSYILFFKSGSRYQSYAGSLYGSSSYSSGVNSPLFFSNLQNSLADKETELILKDFCNLENSNGKSSDAINVLSTGHSFPVNLESCEKNNSQFVVTSSAEKTFLELLDRFDLESLVSGSYYGQSVDKEKEFKPIYNDTSCSTPLLNDNHSLMISENTEGCLDEANINMCKLIPSETSAFTDISNLSKDVCLNNECISENKNALFMSPSVDSGYSDDDITRLVGNNTALCSKISSEYKLEPYEQCDISSNLAEINEKCVAENAGTNFQEALDCTKYKDNQISQLSEDNDNNYNQQLLCEKSCHSSSPILEHPVETELCSNGSVDATNSLSFSSQLNSEKSTPVFNVTPLDQPRNSSNKSCLRERISGEAVHRLHTDLFQKDLWSVPEFYINELDVEVILKGQKHKASNNRLQDNESSRNVQRVEDSLFNVGDSTSDADTRTVPTLSNNGCSTSNKSLFSGVNPLHAHSVVCSSDTRSSLTKNINSVACKSLNQENSLNRINLPSSQNTNNFIDSSHISISTSSNLSNGQHTSNNVLQDNTLHSKNILKRTCSSITHIDEIHPNAIYIEPNCSSCDNLNQLDSCYNDRVADIATNSPASLNFINALEKFSDNEVDILQDGCKGPIKDLNDCLELFTEQDHSEKHTFHEIDRVTESPHCYDNLSTCNADRDIILHNNRLNGEFVVGSDESYLSATSEDEVPLFVVAEDDSINFEISKNSKLSRMFGSKKKKLARTFGSKKRKSSRTFGSKKRKKVCIKKSSEKEDNNLGIQFNELYGAECNSGIRTYSKKSKQKEFNLSIDIPNNLFDVNTFTYSPFTPEVNVCCDAEEDMDFSDRILLHQFPSLFLCESSTENLFYNKFSESSDGCNIESSCDTVLTSIKESKNIEERGTIESCPLYYLASETNSQNFCNSEALDKECLPNTHSTSGKGYFSQTPVRVTLDEIEESCLFQNFCEPFPSQHFSPDFNTTVEVVKLDTGGLLIKPSKTLKELMTLKRTVSQEASAKNKGQHCVELPDELSAEKMLSKDGYTCRVPCSIQNCILSRDRPFHIPPVKYTQISTSKYKIANLPKNSTKISIPSKNVSRRKECINDVVNSAVLDIFSKQDKMPELLVISVGKKMFMYEKNEC